ncbi:MAG: hypothetical protein QOK19_2365 [Solirubrobacteraceae bacterium]|jgi:hypothetical protein|nr:hypothetical protein [Solirubrobacteraceae bacterium]
MTALWIVLAALAALAVALAASMLLRARDGARGRARASIERLTNDTSVDRESGAVRSVQRADLLIERDALEEIWTPVQLERLARTYWRFLTRVTLGLIRVHYSERGRSVVLLTEPLRLLTFEPPEYEMDAARGLVRWRIERGLLVSRRGRDGAGYLQIEVSRKPDDRSERQVLHVEVAVVNFYPSIASGLGLRLYDATQSRIHVIVTYGFLRSLARLDLAESRVGRFLT